LCTGAFRGLHLKRGFLLEPDRIIPPAVAGLARDRRLGILVPIASQITRPG
jgi:protein AroM